MQKFMSENQLHFFASMPHHCGYLDGKNSTSVFADPNGPMSSTLYGQLIAIGFRRSGNHVYRPHCSDCNACIAARVLVDDFQPKRTQRRTWQQNSDITVSCVPTAFRSEHFELYQRYVKQRHSGGGMDDPEPQRYFSFIDSTWCDTLLYEFRLKGKLVGIAITDQVKQGLSAFYTFFDPGLPERSLGKYAILWQIEQAKQLNLPYLYLGYWIAESKKMNYKTQYRPLQLLQHGKWCTLDESTQ